MKAHTNRFFYNTSSRMLQDRADSRRIADRLSETRRKDHFDDTARRIIESAFMFFFATADSNGRPDCSVKGGEPGFVKVVDENALTFPDYDGNGMFRSLGNVLENPAIGMLFIDWTGETRKLRINGLASVSTFNSGLIVRVTALDVFPNCPRYLPDMQVNAGSVYNPRPGYTPPEPLWKSKPDLRGFLPRQKPTTKPEA